MSENSRLPSENRAGRGRIPPRTLAILLMVAGAAGFIFARLALGNEFLYMLPGTLVTFIGLAILIRNPRTHSGDQTNDTTGWAQQSRPQPRPTSGVQRRPIFPAKVPPGLRDTNRQPVRNQPPVSNTPVARDLASAPPTEPPAARIPQQPETLLDQVVAVMEDLGAQVEIDSQRESAGGSRGILRVLSKDGLPYSVLIRDSAGEVDVADVRALYALVTSNGSTGGLLVASTPFTQQAYEWASARHIHLVREDELDEISL
jgi:hypothetical protein